jgi:tetratricopeptide (TPR) repeat protein
MRNRYVSFRSGIGLLCAVSVLTLMVPEASAGPLARLINQFAGRACEHRCKPSCIKPKGTKPTVGDSRLLNQIAGYTARLKRNPNDVDALIERALSYFDLYQTETGEPHLALAEKDIQQALQLAPRNARAWEIRGDVAMLRGDYQQALAAFDKAIDLGADSYSVYMNRGGTHQWLKHYESAVEDFTRAIQLNSKLVDAYVDRAEAYRRLSKYEEALADCDRVIALEPNSPVNYVSRAHVHSDEHKYDKCAEDLLQAIRLNPGDLGVDYQVTSGATLSPEAIKHGEEQMRKMLQDRPAMAEHVTEGDELWTWAVRKFAGEDGIGLIDWNPADPRPAFADWSWRTTGGHRFIRVNLDPPAVEAGDLFESLWSCAVFELHNAAADARFRRIDEDI